MFVTCTQVALKLSSSVGSASRYVVVSEDCSTKFQYSFFRGAYVVSVAPITEIHTVVVLVLLLVRTSRLNPFGYCMYYLCVDINGYSVFMYLV